MKRFLVAALTLLASPVLADPDLPASWRGGAFGTEIAGISERRLLPPLDGAKLAAEDAAAEAFGQPPRFAIPFDLTESPLRSGGWTVLGETAVWRLRVQAPEAVSLNFGFRNVRLVAGAKLWIYAADAVEKGALDPDDALGPYGAEINEKHGEFWTPVLAAGDAIIELEAPAALRNEVSLELARVNQGYRGFGRVIEAYRQPAAAHGEGKREADCDKSAGGARSGSCNMDVACLDPFDPWNEPRRSVARYTLKGQFLCTGSLVNNTANDRRMLFATASHCGVEPGNSSTIVAYWNYEWPTCRTPGSSASSQVNPPDSSQTSSGAVYLAGTRDPFSSETCTNPGDCSDFALVEFDDPADPTLDLYWAGWDRRSTPASCGPQGATASTGGLCASIHHPSGDEKRITFVDSDLEPGSISFAQGVHWRAFWHPDPPVLSGISEPRPPSIPPGVTAPGSSGSPLYSADRRLVGVLSGGPAFCGATGADLSDYYGRLAHAWNGLGTASTRMRDHLDPLGSEPQFIDGIGAAPQAGECPVGQQTTVVWSDDMESGPNGWTLGAGSVQNTWAQITSDSVSGTTSWNAINLASISDQRLVSPPIDLPASGSPRLRFQNRQQMESAAAGCYDGAILEISTDDGSTWTELADSRIGFRPHDGPIADGFNNPLAGSPAWCGDPRGWQDYMIDLTDFAGETVRLRFRVATDQSIGGRDGWLVDDVRVLACGGVSPEAPLSGNWFNPARSGEGCQLTREANGSTWILTCYVYNRADPFATDQVWMIGTGTVADGAFVSSDMVITAGAQYGSGFDPDDVVRTPFGVVEMAFDDCNTGTVTMNPVAAGFEDVVLPMQKIVPVDCASGLPDPANAVRTGNWFNPGRSGEGFQLAVEGSNGLHIITFYTYLDGEPAWLIGTGTIQSDTIVFADTVITSGTGFGADFDAGDVVRTPFGRLTLTFSDCNNATIDVDSVLPQFGDQTIALTRIVQGQCP